MLNRVFAPPTPERMERMPRAPKKPESRTINASNISAIIAELDSILAALADIPDSFDQPDFEDMEFRLDALTTMFFNAGLVPKKEPPRFKFHRVIQTLAVLPLRERESLSEQMKTFEDLINGYGDEPSEDEITEAREIWETVTMALKRAFLRYAQKDQLSLPEC